VSTDELVSTPKAQLADEVFCEYVVADSVDDLLGAASTGRVHGGDCSQSSRGF
jgi:hypothetical protein